MPKQYFILTKFQLQLFDKNDESFLHMHRCKNWEFQPGYIIKCKLCRNSLKPLKNIWHYPNIKMSERLKTEHKAQYIEIIKYNMNLI